MNAIFRASRYMSMQGIQSAEIGKRFQALNGAVAADSSAAPGEKLLSGFSTVLDKIAVALTAAEVDSAGLHDTFFDEVATAQKAVAKAPPRVEKETVVADKQRDGAAEAEETEQNLAEAAKRKKAQKAESGSKQVETEEQKANKNSRDTSQADKDIAKEQAAAEQAAAEQTATDKDTADSAEKILEKNADDSAADKKAQQEAATQEPQVQEPQVSAAPGPQADTTANNGREKSQKDAKVSGEQMRDQSQAEDTSGNADSRSENPEVMKAAVRQQAADNKKTVQADNNQRPDPEVVQGAPEQLETKVDDAVKQFMESLRSRLQAGKGESEEAQKSQKSHKQEPLPQADIPTPAAQTAQTKIAAPVLAGLLLKNAGQAGGEAAKGLQTAVQNVTGGGAAFNTAAHESRSTEAKESTNTQRLPRNFESRTLAKVEEALKEVARSRDGKTISVRLDPPSLGKVKIDVSMRDGMLHARLQADSAQVSSLLREHGLDLQFALRKLGLEVDDVQVVIRDASPDQEQSFDQYTGQQGSQQQGPGQQDLYEAEATVVDTAVAQKTGMTQLNEDYWIA